MNNMQKQCLLACLGYYPTDRIDGKWGELSEDATIRFQGDYGLSKDGVFGKATTSKIIDVISSGEKPQKFGDETARNFWSEIRYFDRGEFECKCGGKYCDGFPAEPEKKLVTVADRVRKYFGNVAIVSSGVRCKQHNANVGGVANSRHLYGKAMDFCVIGKTAKEVLAYAQEQPEIRYAYAIDNNYIHMDIE